MRRAGGSDATVGGLRQRLRLWFRVCRYPSCVRQRGVHSRVDSTRVDGRRSARSNRIGEWRRERIVQTKKKKKATRHPQLKSWFDRQHESEQSLHLRAWIGDVLRMVGCPLEISTCTKSTGRSLTTVVSDAHSIATVHAPATSSCGRPATNGLLRFHRCDTWARLSAAVSLGGCSFPSMIAMVRQAARWSGVDHDENTVSKL